MCTVDADTLARLVAIDFCANFNSQPECRIKFYSGGALVFSSFSLTPSNVLTFLLMAFRHSLNVL